MKICVLSSEYREGVSKKTGKAYKGFFTHAFYEENGVKKVKELFISPELVGGVAPQDGDVMNIDIGFGGFIASARYIQDEKFKINIVSTGANKN